MICISIFYGLSLCLINNFFSFSVSLRLNFIQYKKKIEDIGRIGDPMMANNSLYLPFLVALPFLRIVGNLFD